MAENTVEILIRARDEASKTLNQAIGQVQAASQAVAAASLSASASSTALARSSGAAGQGVQQFARSAQRASRDVTDWAFIMGGLTPQLALASVTTLQLTNAIGEGATKMGLWTAGIGLAVAVGFKLVSTLNEMDKAERDWAQAVFEGNTGPLEKRIQQLKEVTLLQQLTQAGLIAGGTWWQRLGLALDESADATGKVTVSEKELLDTTTKLSLATRNLFTAFERGAQGQAQLTKAIDDINKGRFDKEKEAEKKALDRLNEAYAQLAIRQTDALTKEMALAELGAWPLEQEAAVLALTNALQELGEVTDRISTRRREAQEGRQKEEVDEEQQLLAIRRSFLDMGLSDEEATAKASQLIEQRKQAAALALLRESLEGQRQLFLAGHELRARHAREMGLTEGEEFVSGLTVGLATLEDEVGTFGGRTIEATRGIGHAMFRGIDDTFLKVFTGRLKELPDVAKAMGEDILRELIGVFTGQLKQNILQSITSLFGIRTGPSPATLAAIMPGGGTAAQAAGGVPSFGVPAAPFFNPFATAAPISSAGTTVPTAEVLRDAQATQAAGAASAFTSIGGAAMIFAATQTGHPVSGAITGAIGGAMFAGPVGAVFGAIAGFIGGRQSRRSAKRKAQVAAAWNRFMELVTEKAPFLSPAQFDQIIGFFNITQRYAVNDFQLDPSGMGRLGGVEPTDPVVRELFVQAGLAEMMAQPWAALIYFGEEKLRQIADDLRELRVVTLERGLDLEYEGPLLTREAFGEGITRLEAAPGPGPRGLTPEELIDLWRRMPLEVVQTVQDRLQEVNQLTGRDLSMESH